MSSTEKPKTTMEFKSLTPNTKLPVLGLGTWEMGGEEEADTAYDRENVLAIRAAIELGMSHIDTAEAYGRGHSEDLVGEAISAFRREDLFITTKVSPEHLRYDDVIACAKESLHRLRTEYIDLYLIHHPNPEIPMRETMKGLDFLVERESVRYVGVSNFSVEQMREAQECSHNKIIANQIEYNLLVRNQGMHNIDMESKIIPYCQENGMLVIAWCPLARGKLVGRGYKILDKLTEKYNKTQAQIALNWLISKKSVVAIPKASNIKHLQENLGAISWKLEQEDIHLLDNQFRR